MFGSDPEIFATRSSEVVPAYIALGGDIDISLPFGTAYCDGAAIEFTVVPSEDPSIVAQRTWDNLQSVKEYLRSRNYDYSLVSNADVGKYISQFPESYGERASLQILGCQKDIRVYNWAANQERPNPKLYPYRTIGTHIHIELMRELSTNWPFVQFFTTYLDAILGTTGVVLLADDVTARERMKLYGKSGTIRVKSEESDGYNGVEYRTLPSRAVLSSEFSTYAFFRAAQLVTDKIISLFYSNGFSGLRDNLGGVNKMMALTEAIDTFDTIKCKEIRTEVATALNVDISELECITL